VLNGDGSGGERLCQGHSLVPEACPQLHIEPGVCTQGLIH
jgi:hypothetical protein